MMTSSTRLALFAASFLFTSFLLLASATSQNCHARSHIIPLKSVIHQTYMANYHFIRLGVPALLIETLLSDAIWNVATHCSCTDTTLDSTCISSYFSPRFVVKRVLKEIHIDSFRTYPKKFFPLYKDHKLLPPTNMQNALLRTYLTKHLEDSSTVKHILAPAWKATHYPDEGVLYEDSWMEREKACDVFYSIHDEFPTGYSSHLATAYIVGLLQEVRYAKGDMQAANKVLAQHVSFVFCALRCTGEAWYDLQLLVTFVANNARKIKLLLQNVVAHSKDKIAVMHVQNKIEMVPNVPKIVKYATNSFAWMSECLSSWASSGRSTFYVESLSDILTARIVEAEMYAVPPRKYYSLPRGPARLCSPGWVHVNRAGVGVASEEACCAVPCVNMASHYSSAFSLAVDQEECCRLCNEASCTGDGMDQVIDLFVDNLEDRLACVISI